MPEICWCRSLAGTSTTFITQFRWSVRSCWLLCAAAQEHMRSAALTRIQLRRRRPMRCSCRNASQKGWCCCFASLLLICSTWRGKYSLQQYTFVSIDLMGTMWSSHHYCNYLESEWLLATNVVDTCVICYAVISHHCFPLIRFGFGVNPDNCACFVDTVPNKWPNCPKLLRSAINVTST